ncbi:MAG: ABC transporter substrate-binding protein [Thermodesulfobacteriota bacterium]
MAKAITRRSFLKKSALAGAGLGLAANGFVPFTAWGAEPVKIMLGTTFSGAYAETGDFVRKGAQLAVEMFGGKVLGRPIELIERDVPNPAEGVKKAQEAVEKLGVKYLFVSPTSSTVLAVMEYVAKQKVVLFGAAGADEITGKSCNKFTFRWPVATWSAIREVVPRIIKEFNAKTFFTITPKYVFGEDLLRNTKDVLQAQGLKLLGNLDHPMGESDFSSHLTQAMGAKADCVLFLNFGNDTVNALKQANSFGLQKVSRIGCVWGSELPQMKALGPKVMEGVIWGQQYFFKIDTPGNKKFIEAYRKKFNETGNYLAVNAYLNIMSMLMGMDKAKTDDPLKVVQAIEDFEYEGVTGKEKYRACDHQAVKPYYTVKCKPEKDMKTPEDFGDIIGQSTNIQPCADTGCKL